MKTKAKPAPFGFTLVEAIVVALVLGVVLWIFVLPTVTVRNRRNRPIRIMCINNQKEIGTAYRLLANDNGDRFPAQQSVVSNGWGDFLTNANQGALCWTNYFIMREQMGESPSLLICPSDERKPAASFSNQFGNLNVSYFVGVGANDVYPQSIAGGDRNLGYGTVSYRNYGYSPTDGKGNDVAVEISGSNFPVSWSSKMHSASSTVGMGNILLGDGSAQQTSSAAFRVNWLRNAQDEGNWPMRKAPIPGKAIRLVFPRGTDAG